MPSLRAGICASGCRGWGQGTLREGLLPAPIPVEPVHEEDSHQKDCEKPDEFGKTSHGTNAAVFWGSLLRSWKNASLTRFLFWVSQSV